MAGISDYFPTLFGAPPNPTSDQQARDALIAALARGGGNGAGDYSPIQSKWQGAARLAEGLRTGLANYAQGVAQKQGAAEFANVLAPALRQPPAQQQVTPLPPPPQQAASSGGGGGGLGGIGGLIKALGGASPIGPSTSVPLQALSPREMAAPPPLSVGPPPVQPQAPITPTTPAIAPIAPGPGAGITPQEIQGNQALQDALAAGNRVPPAPQVNVPLAPIPSPPVRPEANMPLPPVRVADAGQITPVPTPRPEDQIPLPVGRPPLLAQAPAPLPPVRPAQIAQPVMSGTEPLSTAPNAGMAQYQNAIAAVESKGSGDYNAVGPVTRSGDRAYGRYQVMGNNIPSWTKEALGQSMTPQQFIASPQAQDAVFNNQFGKSLARGYTPEQAASIWFTGKPNAPNASDRTAHYPGLTGSQYVSKFSQNLPPSGASEAPGGAPGLITPGQGPAQAVASSGGIYPQTATQGNPAIGAMPLPARQGLTNAPFMQPQQPPGQQQNIAPPTPPPQTQPPIPDTGPRSEAAPSNLLAQNIYGQSYSDLPLFGAKPEAAQSPVPSPAAEGEKADQQFPPLQPRPRINTQAALAYLSNPLYAGQQYAAQRQLVLQMLQRQMTQDAAGTWETTSAGPGKYPVQRNPVTGEAKAYPSNPDKESMTATAKNYEYAQSHPGFQEYLQQNEDLKNHVVGKNLVNHKGEVLFSAPETATLDPEAIDFLATRAVEGDNSGLTGMGRGTQGATNLVAVQNRAAQLATERGIDPQGVLDNIAAFGGQKAGARTAGTIGAKTEVYGASAHNALEMAMQRSDEVPRGTFMPYNQLSQAVQKMNSNEPLAVLNAATETAVNEYARATTAIGATTDSQKAHAYNMLNAAQSPQAYKSIVKALQWEVDNFKNSAAGVAEGLRKGTGAAPHQGPLPIPPGPGTPAGSAGPKRFKYDFNGNLTPE